MNWISNCAHLLASENQLLLYIRRIKLALSVIVRSRGLWSNTSLLLLTILNRIKMEGYWSTSCSFGRKFAATLANKPTTAHLVTVIKVIHNVTILVGSAPCTAIYLFNLKIGVGARYLDVIHCFFCCQFHSYLIDVMLLIMVNMIIRTFLSVWKSILIYDIFKRHRLFFSVNLIILG
jgi:hypothetical protein